MLPSELQPEYKFIRTLQAPDHVIFDKALNRYRISSQAFGPSSTDGGLSGDLEQLLLDDGLTSTAMYPAVKRAVGAASLTIAQILGHGLTVEHEPTPTNWYHGGVHGIKDRHKKKLQKNAEEFIDIDQYEAARLEAEKRDLLAKLAAEKQSNT